MKEEEEEKTLLRSAKGSGNGRQGLGIPYRGDLDFRRGYATARWQARARTIFAKMASCLRCMFQLTIPGLIFYAGVLAAQRSVVPPGVPTPAEIYKDVTGEEMPTVSPTEVWEAASGTASSDENASETNSKKDLYLFFFFNGVDEHHTHQRHL
ncbi:unnamed protein product [Notodromas monacha]|uniref:Uncharacterized protein n=1 Tax=Notodromas monacha TaxID=399045 RepID=A0A7R9BTE3_9CRUS|nr:unnamed protein product [Notodromas monacha]CAG0919784.1 unnamed protein product [Notodromas monacha]